MEHQRESYRTMRWRNYAHCNENLILQSLIFQKLKDEFEVKPIVREKIWQNTAMLLLSENSTVLQISGSLLRA